jgi:nucleolysin TIA-1/TIAR
LGAGGGQAGADPNALAAAGQAGQAQWGGADPNSYYSNYWGGMFFSFFVGAIYSASS